MVSDFLSIVENVNQSSPRKKDLSVLGFTKVSVDLDANKKNMIKRVRGEIWH